MMTKGSLDRLREVLDSTDEQVAWSIGDQLQALAEQGAMEVFDEDGEPLEVDTAQVNDVLYALADVLQVQNDDEQEEK